MSRRNRAERVSLSNFKKLQRLRSGLAARGDRMFEKKENKMGSGLRLKSGRIINIMEDKPVGHALRLARRAKEKPAKGFPFRYKNGRKVARWDSKGNRWIPCDTSGRPTKSRTSKKAKRSVKREVQALIFCGRHKVWVTQTNNKNHVLCLKRQKAAEEARKGSLPVSEGAHNLATQKRSSKAVHYCSRHGRFDGYQWGGHRRVCRAPERNRILAQRDELDAKSLESQKHDRINDPMTRHLFLPNTVVQVVNENSSVHKNGSRTPEGMAKEVSNYLKDLVSRRGVIEQTLISLSSEQKRLQKELEKINGEEVDFLSRLRGVVEYPKAAVNSK